ncbi:hypothetical protein MKEN_00557100 [Mycena kentingensis (nom. inval.)]|nr:hypothetical protein MKEN_00557100 [Mycena kentingensis (nom. inval.)]
MSESMPPELWLEAFQYLPFWDLRCVAQTSRSFLSVARILLFSKIVLRPYATPEPQKAQTTQAVPLSPDAAVAYSNKLGFLMSQPIAPLVQRIVIRTAWASAALTTEGESNENTEPSRPLALLRQLAIRMHRFPALTSLSFAQIRIPRSLLAHLATLPNLDEIDIYKSTLTKEAAVDGERTVPRPRKLSLSYARLAAWLPLFGLDRLVQLSLSGCTLSSAGDALPTLPLVSRLSIEFALATIVGDISLLAKFPSVEFLEVKTSGTWPNLKPRPRLRRAPPLPRLKRLTASAQPSIIHLFLPAAPASALVIPWCNAGPAQVVKSLAVMKAQLTGITSLSVSSRGAVPMEDAISLADLHKMLLFFPHLVEFAYTVDAPMYGDECMDCHECHEDVQSLGSFLFFDHLSRVTALPTTLSRLFVFHMSSDMEEFNFRPTPRGLTMTPLRNRLTAQCNTLSDVFLVGEDFKFRWRAGLGPSASRVEEEFAWTRADDEEEYIFDDMLETFREAWADRTPL